MRVNIHLSFSWIELGILMTDGLMLETLGLGLVVTVCDNVSSLVVFAGLVVFCMFIFGGLGLPLCVSSCSCSAIFWVWMSSFTCLGLVVFVFNNVSTMGSLLLWSRFAWLFLVVWFSLSMGSSCVLAMLCFFVWMFSF